MHGFGDVIRNLKLVQNLVTLRLNRLALPLNPTCNYERSREEPGVVNGPQQRQHPKHEIGAGRSGQEEGNDAVEAKYVEEREVNDERESVDDVTSRDLLQCVTNLVQQDFHQPQHFQNSIARSVVGFQNLIQKRVDNIKEKINFVNNRHEADEKVLIR